MRILLPIKSIFGTCSLLIYAVLLPVTISAQSETQAPLKGIFQLVDNQKIWMPFVVVETWATYSFNSDNDANRGDIAVRRLRFGACGTPYAWLKYSFHFHYDYLGEDEYAATKGSEKGFGIWNAYITAKLLKNSDLLNLHAGYFWAGTSREYITAPWGVGSFDKTRSTWYLRNFTTGTGNGIESGIGLGGLINYDGFGISYRLGTHEPKAYRNSQYANRLYSARLMLTIGNPEQSSYKYMVPGNSWRKRNGITLGFGASTQAKGKLTDTNFFNASSSYGADLLIDYKGLRFEGEYYLMQRTLLQHPNTENNKLNAIPNERFDGKEWYIRVGYSFILAGKYLEPVISYENYESTGSKKVYNFIGTDKSLDIGINWYLNKDYLKVSLHYVMQDGSLATKLGNYIGTAFQLRL